MNVAPKSVRTMLRGLLPLLIAGSISACKDNDPQPELPRATQTGANTMGCKIDGRNWIALSAGLFSPDELYASVYEHQGKRQFDLLGVYLPVNEQAPFYKYSVGFIIEDLQQTGEYQLKEVAEPSWGSGSPSYGSVRTNEPLAGRYYYTSPDYTGRVTITRLDTTQHIVSGTFAFKAKQQGGQKEVSVTDGRFDVKYK